MFIEITAKACCGGHREIQLGLKRNMKMQEGGFCFEREKLRNEIQK